MLKETFLNNIKQRHPDNFSKYDYSLLPDEFNMLDKIPIRCLIHGVTNQRAADHNFGKGCNQCAIEYRASNNTISAEECFRKIREVHGDYYGYEKSKCDGVTSKITVTCPVHGDWNIMVLNHIRGQGCYKCGIARVSFNRRYTFKDFISKAIGVHSNRFQYGTEDQWVNYQTKFPIKCSIHGWFLQSPSVHLQGFSCPRCRESFGEKIISELLDKLQIKYQREYRILPHRYFYDFYLPNYNIFIEYHGEQHYKENKFFGGKKALKYSKRRDKTKIELVKRSTGLLIVLKYTFKTQEQIENELLRLFSIIHPEFLHNKELTKQTIIDCNIYLIQDGISYKRK